MDRDTLKAFLQVSERASFSLAAEDLHLTQPAVSKRIAGLENRLNCQLFDRVGREVHLTEAGRALRPRAQQILNALNEAVQAIQDLDGDISGLLSLSTSHHIGLHRLPPVLRHYAQTYPQVELDLRLADSETGYQQILHGEVELALVTLDSHHTGRLEQELLWHDELVFCAAYEHPLSQASNPADTHPLSLKQLEKHRAIVPELNTFTCRILSQLFEQRQLTLKPWLCTNYLETIKMLVSVGLGWSLLPKSMVAGELCQLNVEDQQVSRELGLIRHPRRSLSNAAKAFIDVLKA